MKECFRRLRKLCALFVLAASLVSLVHVSPAEAAAAPKLNRKSRTVFVGGSRVNPAYAEGCYVLKVKNRPDKYSVEWSSDNTRVATVKKNKYRGTVTAVAPGKATITARVTDKTTEPYTVYSLTCRITVKANCAEVRITDKQSGYSLQKGETLQLEGQMYAADGSRTWTGRGVTDTLKWVSDDPEVASVSDGLVTATGAGEATIYCYAAQAATGTYSKLEKATAFDAVKVTVTAPLSEEEVTEAIWALKSKYPEGLHWTNSDYYLWETIYCNCYGCIAFVGELSDQVFGVDAPTTKHTDFDSIKPGDHIRTGGTHSVLVIEKYPDYVVVCEGNYNSSVHWGRRISRSELDSEGFYVQTRY